MTCFEGGILLGTILKTEFGARPPISVGEILQMAQKIGNFETSSQQENDKVDGELRTQAQKPTQSGQNINPGQDRQARPQMYY